MFKYDDVYNLLFENQEFVDILCKFHSSNWNQLNKKERDQVIRSFIDKYCEILTPKSYRDEMKLMIEKMLENYEGTILFVSHDRYFVNKIANSLIVFENGGGKFLKDTTYSEYEKKQELSGANERQESIQNKVDKNRETIIEKPHKVNTYLQNKEKARAEARRKKLEKLIEELEEEISAMEENFSNEEVASDYIKVLEIQKQIDEKSVLLEQYTEEWYSLTE